MSKIKLISIGKTKEEWLNSALLEYIKRLKPTHDFDFTIVCNDTELISHAEKERSTILLDPNGKEMSSEEFSLYFQNMLEMNGSRLTFVIGGPLGIPLELKTKFPSISLSKMTFTHQIARLILLEQIYRATEINKGSKYHK